MDFEDFNPIALIGGMIGGLFSVFLAGMMMPSLLIKIASFLISGVACYVVCDKILS